jgi:hypothetical protein
MKVAEWIKLVDGSPERGIDPSHSLSVAIRRKLKHTPDLREEVCLAGRRLRVEQFDGPRVAMVRLLPDRC